MKTYSIILGLLAFAFFLRVLGQLLVAVFKVRFLPPMEQWSSGLIHYPWLLGIQVLILGIQAVIWRDLWRGTGFFARGGPRAATALSHFSYVYFVTMVVRYIVMMSYYPERRWFTGTIPIFFHWVLAGYLFTLGRCYRLASQPPVPSEK